MKNVLPAINAAERCAVQGSSGRERKSNQTPRRWKIVRSLSVSLLLLAVALLPTVSPFAQKRKEGPYKVTGVSTRQTSDGAVVTVSADAPLTRTQTWQDEEGFHMSLPDASPGSLSGLPRGVTVRNLGKTLEVVVAVKPGSDVTVDPQSNRLNLIIKGGVDSSRSAAQLESQAKARHAAESVEQASDYESPVRQPRERRASMEALPLPANAPPASAQTNASLPSQGFPAASSPGSPQSDASPGANASEVVPANEAIVRPAPTHTDASGSEAAISSEESEGGIFSYVFSMTGILIILLIGLVAFVLARKHRAGKDPFADEDEKRVELVSLEASRGAQEQPVKDRRKLSRRKSDKALVKTNAAVVSRPEVVPSAEEALERRPIAAPIQPALYGAYRVDQEVGKLVLGQAHRLDVLSSRAPDDRRALETSLIKAMNASESGEDGRRRARRALEEYGFVARQSASLLLAHNAYDRASSARILGEIGSTTALPFLLEALYDTESIVRTEAVTSLGSLKMPSAIGALLDMARRYPEMPATILSNALTACSVECLDFFDVPVSDRPLLDAGDGESYISEIKGLELVGAVEALPEWFEDEEFSEALEKLKDADVEARAAAARRLSQFQVQRAVEALSVLAADDPESMVRSAAVTSLGEINHESVFASVLMAFADEAREVRAAAARSLSRMNLDRAEGYVRLIETADAELLSKVARACVKAGMVGQAIDRLISEDRRLAYEAFSLLSLVAKADEMEPLMDAINNHSEDNVRLALIHLLSTTNRPDIATQLRHLAVREGISERVRAALMEVVYKMDQTQPV